MKQIIITLAFLLVACFTFTSCSKDEEIFEEQQELCAVTFFEQRWSQFNYLMIPNGDGYYIQNEPIVTMGEEFEYLKSLTHAEKTEYDSLYVGKLYDDVVYFCVENQLIGNGAINISIYCKHKKEGI